MYYPHSMPAITPTITHRVRAFLDDQGLSLKPWSGLDETYEALYRLLWRKRDEPAFWGPVRELLEAIIDNATDGGRLAASQAELLRSWDVEELLGELRAALQPATPPTSAAQFASRLAAPVMGGFLLLGLVASGCSAATRADADTDAAMDADIEWDADIERDADAEHDAEELSWAEGCDLDRSSVLFSTLRDNESLNDMGREFLCHCFASLNTSWNDGLEELFASGTPEEVALALRELNECCSSDRGQLEGEFADARDHLLDGSLCFVAMPYRGVAFPRQWRARRR